MRIIPSPKGFVAGNLRFMFKTVNKTHEETSQNTPSWFDCLAATTEGGISITGTWTSTCDEDLQMQISPATKYLLVIEKEGIYRKLCEDRFHERVPCIMVTGCGYPDIATRALVSKVSRRFPSLEVIGICDYNPHGAALLLTYRFPSAASAFEGEDTQTENLRCD